MPTNNNTNQYRKLVNIAAFSATVTALLLVAFKLYAWLVTDASAMLASTTDSLLDLFASIMNVVILKYALAPADNEHRFGHGKAESLAGLVQSAFVMGSALLLVFHGVDRMISPQVVQQSAIGIGVTVIAIMLTLCLVIIQKMVIKKTQSVAISADALHYQSDLILNIGVLLALFLTNSVWMRADGFFTVLVGGYLFWGAAKIIWLSIYQLMDHELTDDEKFIITEIVNSHHKTYGLHDLRTRQSGPIRFIQFHLELDNNLSLFEAHEIGESIEKTIEEKLSPCEVFIHHDPHTSEGSLKKSSITEKT